MGEMGVLELSSKKMGKQVYQEFTVRFLGHKGTCIQSGLVMFLEKEINCESKKII